MDTVDTNVVIYSEGAADGKVGVVERGMSTDALPAYLNEEGEACLQEQASLYFVCTVPGDYGMRRTTVNLYGSVMKCEIFSNQKERVTFIYAHVNQDVCPIFTSVLVPMNAAFSGKYQYDQRQPASLATIKLVVPKGNPRCYIKAGRLKELIGGATSEKISAGHHEHFRANEMYKVLTEVGRRRAHHIGRLKFQPHHAMMSGLMLWLEVLPDTLFDLVIGTSLLDSASVEEFAKLGKQISVKAKQLQNLVDIDLRPIFEIDVLVNRVTKDVDWDQEKENRVNPKLAELTPDEVYRKAKDIFLRRDKTVVKPEKVTWEKFWHSRWQWSAAGSIFTTYAEDTQYVSKERALANKFITLIKMGDVRFETLLNRAERIDARASVKYEWGKVRAIYGCDLTSYIMSTFAFNGCEESLPAEFPVGGKATARYVSSVVTALLDGKLPFTLDFEDFNSQHSTKSMQAVLKAWLDVYHSYLSDEQYAAGLWTMNSLSATYVHNKMPGIADTYKANGTLFSGWRLTSFVNTVLNKIYTDTITKVEDLNQSLHNGDDVLIATRNMKVAFKALKLAKKYNIRLQPTKTAFGSIAEFLRIDHSAPDGGQYATRSIATLVHSRIESGPASEAKSALESFESRYKDFWHRTGRIDLVIRMRKEVEPRLAQIFRAEVGDFELMRTHHTVVGGLGDSLDHRVDYKFKVISEDIVEFDPQELSLVAAAPGIKDYARELARLFEVRHLEPKFAKRIKEATEASCRAKRLKLVKVPNDTYHKSSIYRSLYRAHRHVSSVSMFGKAKLVGFAVDVLTKLKRGRTLSNHLNNSETPMEFLSAVC